MRPASSPALKVENCFQRESRQPDVATAEPAENDARFAALRVLPGGGNLQHEFFEQGPVERPVPFEQSGGGMQQVEFLDANAQVAQISRVRARR